MERAVEWNGAGGVGMESKRKAAAEQRLKPIFLVLGCGLIRGETRKECSPWKINILLVDINGNI